MDLFVNNLALSPDWAEDTFAILSESWDKNLVVKIRQDDILSLQPKSVGVQRSVLQRSQSTPCPQISNPLNHTLLFDKLPAQHPNSFLYLDGSDHFIVFDIDKVPAQHRSCFFDPPGSPYDLWDKELNSSQVSLICIICLWKSDLKKNHNIFL